MRSSSSFPRIPTLLDFRAPPRTDNLLHVTLHSSQLALDVLLESGLPWGVPTTLVRTEHHVSCGLQSSGAATGSADTLNLLLEFAPLVWMLPSQGATAGARAAVLHPR